MNGKQLKNSILQWAIQGKLVEQNPKDEPASKLLERIAAQKAVVNGAKKSSSVIPASEPGPRSSSKKAKSSKAPISRIYRENGSWFEQVGSAEPKDITEEIPFDIPESWEWCRLGNICSKFSTGPFGTMLHKEDYVENGGVPLVNPTNIKQGQIFASSIKQVNKAKYEVLSSFVLNENDIVIARRGDLSKCAVIGAFENGWLAGTGAFFLHLIFIEPNFFVKIYTSPYVQQYLIGDSVGTTMDNLNQSLLGNLLFPLPPVAEQKRIVNKLEQILPLVDEYDQAQTQLDKLNKELPESLKKSILQQAIQGKLVPQDPNDEPAQALLDRISAERVIASLSVGRQGGAKQSKKSSAKVQNSRIYRDTDGLWYEQIGTSAPKDITEEIPFDIPENWVWSRFGNFISITTGLAYKKEDLDIKSDESIRVLRGGNIDYGKWCKKDDDVIIASKFVNPELFLKKGMFITPAVTSLEQMGKTALIEENQENIVVGGFVMMLTSSFNDDAFLKYLLNFFQSYYYKKFCQSITNKSGQAFYNLSRQKLLQGLVPLPPLAEQKRIVAKLEELFEVV